MDAACAWAEAGSTVGGEGRAERAPASAARAAVSPASLARSLQSVGPLLCLYPMQHAQPLSGWSRWRAVSTAVDIDSEGPWEALVFFDAAGATCWQLGLLPDADYYAWEKLLAGLPDPVAPGPGRAGPACSPLTGLRHGWRACALRFFDRGEGQLAAAVPALSATALRVAAHVALRRRAMLAIE